MFNNFIKHDNQFISNCLKLRKNFKLHMGPKQIFRNKKKLKNELIKGYIKSKMLYYDELYNACLSNDVVCEYYLASVSAYRDVLAYLENNL